MKRKNLFGVRKKSCLRALAIFLTLNSVLNPLLCFTHQHLFALCFFVSAEMVLPSIMNELVHKITTGSEVQHCFTSLCWLLLAVCITHRSGVMSVCLSVTQQ